MIAELEEKRATVVELCHRHGVERLEVFGSAARGEGAAAVNDFDFIVRFLEPGNPGYADRYLAFAEALERVFNQPVDLLTERSIRNPILKRAIDRDRRVVYAAA